MSINQPLTKNSSYKDSLTSAAQFLNSFICISDITFTDPVKQVDVLPSKKQALCVS